MNKLVCYDVNTEDSEGRRRLRQVAKTCQAFGQRVQYSVFECSVQPADVERMRQRLLEIIDDDLDSLRIYRLSSDRDSVAEVYGRDLYRDMKGPLII